MADTAVFLNISDMIDLAIGTPEVGMVDFNMLQTVLHCLAQQLRVLGKNVEIRGSIVLPTGRDNGQTIAISEYVVETDKKPEKMAAAVPPPSAKDDGPETILVVERIKKSESPTGQSPMRDGSPPPRGPASAAMGAAGAISVPGTTPSTEKLSLVTISKFNLLENAVEDLKNRVYGSIPKNDQILEEVRSQTNLKAITDMWTSLNVSSRLEAAEEGIGKLSSLVQDLITETAGAGVLEALQKRTAEGAEGAAGAGGTADGGGVDVAGLKELIDSMRLDIDEIANSFNKAMEELNVDIEPLVLSSGAGAEGKGAEGQAGGGASGSATETGGGGGPGSGGAVGVSKVDAASGGGGADKRRSGRPGGRRSASNISADLMSKVVELEKKLNKCCDTIGKNEGIIQDQITSFQDQLEYLSKQVAALSQDPSGNKLTPDLVKDLQGLMQLFTTVQEMQEQLAHVHETALQLAAEKEDRQHNMNALLEQIELLKTVKLDREDMVEAMAEKADLRMLARKVSHDQFELACDDLSRGLEHALGKLNIQESLWQQALDDIQREIETKLDKMELSPVKEFFNNKLKQLQENLKQMASLRKEAEAAGTKRRLLRDVNCISCDAKAVMPMEPPSTVPVLRPLQANLSMKPYLSYELDAIRKSQQTNVPQRNMHDWEAIDKNMGQKQPHKPKSEPDKHLCNRYCGGSHTVTTPAQRVARLGHFIKQWGPDVLPLSSGLAAGDDGRLYKVSPVEGANVGPGGAVDTTCTAQPPKQEKPRTPPKSIVISAECRCLDGEQPTK